MKVSNAFILEILEQCRKLLSSLIIYWLATAYGDLLNDWSWKQMNNVLLLTWIIDRWQSNWSRNVIKIIGLPAVLLLEGFMVIWSRIYWKDPPKTCIVWKNERYIHAIEDKFRRCSITNTELNFVPTNETQRLAGKTLNKINFTNEWIKWF